MKSLKSDSEFDNELRLISNGSYAVPLITLSMLFCQFNLTVGIPKMEYYAISILSVNPLNGKLLVSEWTFEKLRIIDDVHRMRDNNGIQEIIISYEITVSKEISDALWSHNGNIIYTEPGSVFVMLPNGTIISTTNMTSPTQLSLSNDGGIYLAEKNRCLRFSRQRNVMAAHV